MISYKNDAHTHGRTDTLMDEQPENIMAPLHPLVTSRGIKMSLRYAHTWNK